MRKPPRDFWRTINQTDLFPNRETVGTESEVVMVGRFVGKPRESSEATVEGSLGQGQRAADSEFCSEGCKGERDTLRAVRRVTESRAVLAGVGGATRSSHTHREMAGTADLTGNGEARRNRNGRN
jgi:hypothetical protein